MGSLGCGIFKPPSWEHPVSTLPECSAYLEPSAARECDTHTRLVWTLSWTFELHTKWLVSWSSERVSVSLYTGILDLVWVLSNSGFSDGGCIFGALMLSRWAERLPALVVCLCCGTSCNMLHVYIRFCGNFWLQDKRWPSWFLYTLWETRTNC
jgi:hypothetical protein